MSEVLCWYCENFVFFSDNPDEKNCIGVCTYKKIICDAQSRVCEDFIMRSGLHTKKSIPGYCRNYCYNTDDLDD